jgi:hypothetical protein
MIQICAFEKKEKSEGKPQLGGLWKDLSLVVNGETSCLVANVRFQAWWPLEGSKLDGPWNVPCLIAFGRRRRNKNIIFTSIHFSPHKILLKPFLS